MDKQSSQGTELPPLPEPAWKRFGAAGEDAFMRSQMREYARAAVVAALAQAAPQAAQQDDEPVAWIRKTDITELTDSAPETDGWTPLYARPAAVSPPDGAMPDVPSKAMQCANALLADMIGKREWDVPCAAQHMMAFAATDWAKVNASLWAPVVTCLAAQPAEGSAQVATISTFEHLHAAAKACDARGLPINADELRSLANDLFRDERSSRIAAPARSDTPAGLNKLTRYIPNSSMRHYADFPEGPMCAKAGGDYVLFADVCALFATPTAASKALDAAPVGREPWIPYLSDRADGCAGGAQP